MKNQAILERINKDNRNKEEALESEFYAEQYANDVKSQFLDNNDLEAIKELQSQPKIVMLAMENKSLKLNPIKQKLKEMSDFLFVLKTKTKDESIKRHIRNAEIEIYELRG